MKNTIRNLIALHRVLLRSSSGATMIEFALVFPIFILFLFMVFEYGLMYFGNSIMTNMNNQTARASIVGCLDAEFDPSNPTNCKALFVMDEAKIRNIIVERSAGLIKSNDATLFSFGVTSVAEVGANKINLGQGSEIRVFRMSYRWPVFFTFLKNIPPYRSMMNFETYTVVRNEPFGTLTNRRNDP